VTAVTPSREALATFGDDRLPERFWQKVRIAETGCWLWVGAINDSGYGTFWLGRSLRSHRLTYETLVASIGELHLDHLCRVRNCVNPEHLEPVTNAVNVRRGESFAAVNAVKTHCPAGHPFTVENTYWHGAGRKRGRGCRTCKNEQARARWRARHALSERG
jgi:hypothetical protein